MAFDRPELATAVCREAFGKGLLLETSGVQSEVVKLMPPLVVDDGQLDRGLAIVAESIGAVTAGELVGATGGSAR